MPTNKDLKRLVRARMTKTGEAYTAALAQITKKTGAKAPRSGPPAAEYAVLAGMNDKTLKEKTGRTWDGWVRELDTRGADQMSHRDIAALVKTTYRVPSWWTQTVTVGYERIKGLRVRGQQRNGTYEMTKSRTFNVSVDELFDAWATVGTRKRWLTGAVVKVRAATRPKSMRLDWSDGGIVAVGFVAKGARKSSVAVEHSKLPDRETVDRLKQDWSARLDALKATLSGD